MAVMLARRLLPARLLAPIDRVQHVADLEHSQEQHFEMLIHSQRIASLDKLLYLGLGRSQIGIKSEHANGSIQEIID